MNRRYTELSMAARVIVLPGWEQHNETVLPDGGSNHSETLLPGFPAAR